MVGQDGRPPGRGGVKMAVEDALKCAEEYQEHGGVYYTSVDGCNRFIHFLPP